MYRNRPSAETPLDCSGSAAEPGGFDGLVYYRWHGSPRMYDSDYAPAAIAELAGRMPRHPRAAEVWCIVDNTSVAYATGNALTLQDWLGRPSGKNRSSL
jgi:uncharacterized protein YecE (DUF72 family)